MLVDWLADWLAEWLTGWLADVGVISGAIKYIVLDFDLSTLQEVGACIYVNIFGYSNDTGSIVTWEIWGLEFKQEIVLTLDSTIQHPL